MPVFNNALAGAAGQSGGDAAGYKIERSLRFDNSATANLSRQFVQGNQKKWTWSAWVKRSKLIDNDYLALFTAPVGSNANDGIFFRYNGISLSFGYAGSGIECYTSSVFRDTSAWYNICVSVNTDEGTPANRIKVWVNNQLYTLNQYPSQGATAGLGSASLHHIGLWARGTNTSYPFGGYMAEVHYLDGIAITSPEGVFGEYSSTTGAWDPIEYTGSYNGTYSVNYADHFVYSNADGGTIANVFDGSTSTEFEFNSSGGTGRFQPPGGIAYTSSIEIYTARSTTMNVSLNGGSNVAYGGGWTTIATGSGTLTELAFTNGNAGNQRLGAIRVDGTVLTTGTAATTNGFRLDFSDNSSNAALGTDSSGNNNTWTVNNFSIQDYVNYTNGTYTVVSGGSILYPDRAFNGNIQNFTIQNGIQSGTNEWTWEPTTPITGITTLKLYLVRSDASGSASNFQYKINNGSYVDSGVAQNNDALVTISNPPSTLSKLSFKSVISNNSSGLGLSGVQVNGTYLANNDGAENDSVLDSPTNYEASSGNNGGNYCTLSPSSQSSGTFSQGNLKYVGPGSWRHAYGTMAFTSGKWYYEVTYANAPYGQGVSNDHNGFGWGEYKTNDTTGPGSITTAVFLQETGWYKNFTGSKTNANQTMAAGDVVSVAVDLDANTFEFKRNGTSVVSGTIGGTVGRELAPFVVSYDNSYGVLDFNFGQRPFAYTPPTGYKSLCTQNIDDPAILKGSEYFQVSLWDGDGASSRTIPTDHEPDLVWVKNRTGSGRSHYWYDAVRGFGANKELVSNSDVQEGSNNHLTQNHGYVSGTTSTGFTLAAGATNSTYTNDTGDSYVAWTWDAGTTNTTVAAGGLNSSAYDTRTTWSNGLTANDRSFNSSYPATQFFDGDKTTFASTGGSGGGNSSGTIDLGSYFPASNGPYRVVLNATSSHPVCTINGVQNDTTLNGNAAIRVWTSVASVPSIVLDNSGAFGGSYIEINGKILVDSGATPPNVPNVATTYRANPTSGVSIITYTGNGQSGANVAHGLATAPKFYTSKCRSHSSMWMTRHTDIANTHYLQLDQGTRALDPISDVTGDADPTDLVIPIGAADANNNGRTQVMYAFSPVEGFSAMGVYQANGSTAGPFNYCGFRPRWILLKSSTDTTARNWYIYDTLRDTDGNPTDRTMQANLDEYEGTTSNKIDILANGFKITNTGTSSNYNLNYYVWMAFAEHPFKYARAY